MKGSEMSDQATPTGKTVRFSLRELFVLVTLVALAIGFFLLARDYPATWIFPFILSFTSLIGFTIFVMTRGSALAIVTTTCIFSLLCFCLFPIGHGPEPSRRMQCSNQLKQIGLALQWYHDTYGSLPPAYLADSNGKPIHSWRVLLLPFMDQKALFNKYSFDEPWNGPNNRKLHQFVMEAYRCPSRPRRQSATDTSYVVVTGPNTMWPGSKSTSFADISDGTSNTLMVVEMANSGIHWMEPRDLDMATMPLAINAPNAPSISSPHHNVALAVFVDGHTSALSKNTPAKIVELLLTIADGQQIPDY
jgi:hypothetical protein